MAANPAPSVISAPLWQLWERTAADTPGVRLGGIYAPKRGYHNTAAANKQNWPGDYSIRVPADLVSFNQGWARAIDWTMSNAEMVKRTNRLRASALDSNDNRLFAMREFIGTRDNKTVYCLIKDDEDGPWRFDGGRDSTHLWHIHGSKFTKYVNSWAALEGIVSVWKGETLAQWNARKESVMLIKYGDGAANGKEEEVKYWQRRLFRLGFNPGAFDGEYQDATQKAVTASRTAYGYGNPGAREISGTHGERMDYEVSRLEALKAANATAAQMKTALEQALSELPQIPGTVTIDLPDTITIPIQPGTPE